MYKKENLLFIILGGFFITNALVAEFISAKIFSLEASLGFDPVSMTLFGESGLSFNLTVGVLLWPVVFIMTDVINEYYGRRGVRLLSFLAVGLISYAFVMVYFSISVEPAGFWQDIHSDIQPSINTAYTRILGQGMAIIVGSLIAFLIGQLVDVTVFHKLRKITGSKNIWIRATGSTLVSQFIDSYVVLFVAFYALAGDQRWTIPQVIATGTVNYVYKFLMAVVLTPAIYLAHWIIDKYLGKELSEKLMAQAAGEEIKS
ncbi:MAG: queuosine precursor transporter [Bacteroidetes bacterium]|nr:queuosine precursor transporter [Bacteroidota bacterium]